MLKVKWSSFWPSLIKLKDEEANRTRKRHKKKSMVTVNIKYVNLCNLSSVYVSEKTNAKLTIADGGQRNLAMSTMTNRLWSLGLRQCGLEFQVNSYRDKSAIVIAYPLHRIEFLSFVFIISLPFFRLAVSASLYLKSSLLEKMNTTPSS